MDFIYVILAFSFIYLVLLRAVMLKLGMRDSNDMRARLSELDKKFFEASKKGDTEAMQKINEEKIPISMKMLNMQMKMMVPMLVVFFVMVFALNSINFNVNDDVKMGNATAPLAFQQTSPSMEAFKITGKDAGNTTFTGYVYISRERNISAALEAGYTIYPIIKAPGNYKVYAEEKNGTISLMSENVTALESVQYDNGTESNLFVPLDFVGIRFIYGAQGLFIFLGFLLGMAEQMFMGKALNNALEKAMGMQKEGKS
jgi:hypothetical protein